MKQVPKMITLNWQYLWRKTYHYIIIDSFPVDTNCHIFLISNSKNNRNKNTLTGQANCKKTTRHHPTYHYVQNQGKLMMQSQEKG